MGAKDRQRGHDVFAAVLFYPFEGIEIKGTALGMLTFGIDAAYQYPAAHVTWDCQIVAVEQEESPRVVRYQPAGPQRSQIGELLRQDRQQLGAGDRLGDVVDRYNGIATHQGARYPLLRLFLVALCQRGWLSPMGEIRDCVA